MGALAIGSVLFGIIIGKLFRWPALIPAFLLAIIFILVNPAHAERTLRIVFFQTALSIVSLQIGYVIGMLALNIGAASKHPKNFRNPTPDDTRVVEPRLWRDRS
jgi:hypothetical protein